MNRAHLSLAVTAVLAGCATSPPAAPSSARPIEARRPADLYAKLVERAESGEAVDFDELRLAYLDSPEFAQGRAAHDRVLDLRKAMFEAMKADDAATARARADETLKLVYVDLHAQKARHQACAILKDQTCAERGKRVATGLLKSVVSSGNGRSCGTAWKVVTVDEEYFVLDILEMDLSQQSLVDRDGHTCDQMDVKDGAGRPRTYYFDVGSMLAAQQRLLEQRQGGAPAK
jgi:hypothetical protein